MPHMPAVRETSYLTATNCEKYRHIMRMFYRQMDKNRNQLYAEEIRELLLDEYPDIFDENYDADQMRADLDSLVTWNNLTPYQDTRRVYTIADYVKKQYRYEMSEAAIEVERMVMKLETLHFETANLSSNYFRRIEEALEHRPDPQEASLKKMYEWWESLLEDFRGMNRNYKDYLREFHTGQSEKILKSVEFVIHKDRFISYLREFILELQHSCDRISYLIRMISEDEKQEMLEKVIESELALPRPDKELEADREAYYRENIPGRWESLEQWFISKNGYPSECSQVLTITNEIIGRIIQNAALIVQLQNWGISRKSDYKNYMKVFCEAESLEDAHRFSAHVFGIQHVRHLMVTGDRQTDRINSSTSEEEPADFLLKPHTRRYQPRMDKTGFMGKTLQKQLTKQKYLERLEKERKLILQYTKNNMLSVAEIDEVVPPFVRLTILRWIAAANMTADHSGQTDSGRRYHVSIESDNETAEPRTDDNSRCVLHCEDGELEMPAYVIRFDEVEE